MRLQRIYKAAETETVAWRWFLLWVAISTAAFLVFPNELAKLSEPAARVIGFQVTEAEHSSSGTEAARLEPFIPAEARNLIPLVVRAAREAGLDPALVAAVIYVESRFDPAAVSSDGAVGLMQIKPSTAGLTANELLDPAVNLRAGTAHLAHLIREYGDVERALAAYNMGRAGLERWERRGGGQARTAYTMQVTALAGAVEDR